MCRFLCPVVYNFIGLVLLFVLSQPSFLLFLSVLLLQLIFLYYVFLRGCF